MNPIRIARELSKAVDRLSFGEPVTHVYNPLDYAKKPHEAYLERFANVGCQALLIGMNPGPFGMAQTGVPFGEVAHARDWLGLEAPVKKPKNEHPKRPVVGFECTRSEVSGERVWSWAKKRFKTPERFFETFFVWNYCPLVFMEESGRNRTPDKLPAKERDPLFEVCDQALQRIVEHLGPEQIIGIGRFAQNRATAALKGDWDVGTVLHPSPASPLANKGWEPQAEKQLKALGIKLGPKRTNRR